MTHKLDHIINEVYKRCKAQEGLHRTEIKNFVKEIYKPFSGRRNFRKFAEITTPPDLNAKVSIVYQSIENLQYLPSSKS